MAPQTFQLVMRSGPNPGKAYMLNKGEVYLGRDISNDIVINDPEISRKHARLVLQGGGYILEDLGSTNGTFADGQRLMGPRPMRTGELVMFGESVSLVYEVSPFDQDATLIAASGEAQVYPTPSTYPSQPEQPAPLRQTPPTAYSGQVPPGPYEAPPQVTETRRESRVWLLAGCGCLVVLLCVLLAAAYAFDYLNLYCTSPFNALFNCP